MGDSGVLQAILLTFDSVQFMMKKKGLVSISEEIC